MSKINLTDVLVRTTPAPLVGRLEISDQRCPGLTLRVTPAGVRSWTFRFRDKTNGQLERLSLGRYPSISLAQARALATKHRATVDLGGNPRELARRTKLEAPTELKFDELLARYLNEYVAKRTPKSYATVKSYSAAVDKALGERPVSEIARIDIIAFLAERAQTAPAAANRTRTILGTLFNWAIDQELIASNPFIRIPKPGLEKPRDRVLTDDELKLIFNSLDALDPSIAAVLKLIALTGQRPGEVLRIELNEITDITSHKTARWELPSFKTKNARHHVVPLVGQARSIVASAVEQATNGVTQYIFASRKSGSCLDRHSIARAFKRLIRSLDSPQHREVIGALKANPPTPHDLRRTFITGARRIGIGRDVVKAVVNHSDYSVTERHYDRYDMLREKRQALGAWDRYVGTLLAVEESNVIAFVSL